MNSTDPIVQIQVCLVTVIEIDETALGRMSYDDVQTLSNVALDQTSDAFLPEPRHLFLAQLGGEELSPG